MQNNNLGLIGSEEAGKRLLDKNNYNRVETDSVVMSRTEKQHPGKQADE